MHLSSAPGLALVFAVVIWQELNSLSQGAGWGSCIPKATGAAEFGFQTLQLLHKHACWFTAIVMQQHCLGDEELDHFLESPGTLTT